MAVDEEPSQHLNAAIFARIFFITVVGGPTFVVLLHFLSPTLVWLRALACGLVVVPGVLLLTILLVRVTEWNGSILNGWAIILPFIAGLFSVNYGWAAPIWTLGTLAALYVAGVAYFWIVERHTRRHG